MVIARRVTDGSGSKAELRGRCRIGSGNSHRVLPPGWAARVLATGRAAPASSSSWTDNSVDIGPTCKQTAFGAIGGTTPAARALELRRRIDAFARTLDLHCDAVLAGTCCRGAAAAAASAKMCSKVPPNREIIAMPAPDCRHRMHPFALRWGRARRLCCVVPRAGGEESQLGDTRRRGSVGFVRPLRLGGVQVGTQRWSRRFKTDSLMGLDCTQDETSSLPLSSETLDSDFASWRMARDEGRCSQSLVVLAFGVGAPRLCSSILQLLPRAGCGTEAEVVFVSGLVLGPGATVARDLWSPNNCVLLPDSGPSCREFECDDAGAAALARGLQPLFDVASVWETASPLSTLSKAAGAGLRVLGTSSGASALVLSFEWVGRGARDRRRSSRIVLVCLPSGGPQQLEALERWFRRVDNWGDDSAPSIEGPVAMAGIPGNGNSFSSRRRPRSADSRCGLSVVNLVARSSLEAVLDFSETLVRSIRNDTLPPELWSVGCIRDDPNEQDVRVLECLSFSKGERTPSQAYFGGDDSHHQNERGIECSSHRGVDECAGLLQNYQRSGTPPTQKQAVSRVSTGCQNSTIPLPATRQVKTGVGVRSVGMEQFNRPFGNNAPYNNLTPRGTLTPQRNLTPRGGSMSHGSSTPRRNLTEEVIGEIVASVLKVQAVVPKGRDMLLPATDQIATVGCAFDSCQSNQEAQTSAPSFRWQRSDPHTPGFSAPPICSKRSLSSGSCRHKNCLACNVTARSASPARTRPGAQVFKQSLAGGFDETLLQELQKQYCARSFSPSPCARSRPVFVNSGNPVISEARSRPTRTERMISPEAVAPPLGVEEESSLGLTSRSGWSLAEVAANGIGLAVQVSKCQPSATRRQSALR